MKTSEPTATKRFFKRDIELCKKGLTNQNGVGKRLMAALSIQINIWTLIARYLQAKLSSDSLTVS